MLDSIGIGSIAVFHGSDEKMRNSDVEYPYRQDSDFYYLTGFEEPESACLLVPGADHPFALFVRPNNPESERWSGVRSGVIGAMRTFGADTAYSIGEFRKLLSDALRGKKTCYVMFEDSALYAAVSGLLRGIWRSPPADIVDAAQRVHRMRTRKDADEIARIRKAAGITCEALKHAMQATGPGMAEYQIQAELEYTIKIRGCPRDAFPAIVASGPNALIAHYSANTRTIGAGDLVLVDAGAEYGYYAADVTRTFPATGAFTSEQKAIYTAVLRAQLEGIDAITPRVSASDVQDRVFGSLKKSLLGLGLIADTTQSWQTWMWSVHAAIHPIGLDVHDVSPYEFGKEWGENGLSPGMVVTVEPGLYIDEKRFEEPSGWIAKNTPSEAYKAFVDAVRPAVKKFAGIGIRIEDDVLVTDSGREVLSSGAPKRIEDIEATMREGFRGRRHVH